MRHQTIARFEHTTAGALNPHPAETVPMTGMKPPPRAQLQCLHVGVCCFLILVFGVSLALYQRQSIELQLAGRLYSGARTLLRPPKASPTPTAFATEAFQYWVARVHSKVTASRNATWRGPNDDTFERLVRLGFSPAGDHCLYLFSYTPQRGGPLRVSWDENSRVCRTIEGDHFWKRAQVLAAAIEMVMEPHRDEFTHPFQFYMDVTDGTRDLPELTLLGLPVVSWAFSQQNTWVLPFADYYSIVGHFFPQLQPRMPPELHDWGETMHGVYGPGKIPLVDWATKLPEAVYRGACSLTFDPDSATANLAIRPELCRRAALTPYLDMGMSPFGAPGTKWATQQLANVAAACTQCAVREGGALTRAQMLKYKYQLVVDGWATSCDSTHWKLLSNSAVLIVRPDGVASPPWAFWYQPFLVPYQHFLPSTIGEVGDKIRWCRENDEKAREIAGNAREFVLSRLTPESVGHFMLLALRYLSDLNKSESR